MHRAGKRVRATGIALIFLFLLLPISASHAADYSMVRVRLSTGTAQSMSATLNGRYFLQENDYVINTKNITVRLSTSLPGSVSVVDGNGQEIYRGTKATIIRLDDQQGQSGLITMNNSAHGTRSYLGHMEFRANGSALMVISIVPLEQYLIGVVAHEMSNTWPLEALKAQAVAARCYAVRLMGGGGTYDLLDTAANQVYKGYNAQDANVIRAVSETQYQVMMYGNEIVNAYYAASNGGQTELASNAWTSSIPYLTMKDDPYDLRNPFSPKLEVFFPSAVSAQTPMNSRLDAYLRLKAVPALQAMGVGVTTTDQFQILGVQSLVTHSPKYAEPSRSHQQATAVLLVGFAGVQNVVDPQTGELVPQAAQQTTPVSVTFNIQDLKDANQPYQLFSPTSTLRMFWGEAVAGGFKIYNVRYGHGVGMSQRGAQQMANEGLKYDQILNFYYSGIRLSTISAQPAPAPTPQSAVVSGATIGVVNANSVNMRSAAKTSASVLYKLNKGTQVEVVSQTGTWYKVIYKKKTGYISADLVQLLVPTDTQPQQPQQTQPQQNQTVTGTINAASVNVRSGAGTGYGVVAKLEKDMQVNILSQANGWYQIQVQNVVGYISAEYVTINPIGTTNTVDNTMSGLDGPAPTLNPNNFYGQAVSETVVYSKASSSGKQLGKLTAGYVVQIKYQTKEYYEIVYKGGKGYVLMSQIKLLAKGALHPNPAQLAEQTAKMGTVTAKATVYSKASTSGKKLGTVEKGQQLEYVGTSGSYCKVVYNGATGYIQSKYYTKPK